MVTIIDYGLGNLGSIANMFKKIGERCEISRELHVIQKATKILLPGVGAFDAAMIKINELGLDRILKQKALEEKTPFLGICLGMQLLTQGSEEGILPGLGFFSAKTVRFTISDPTIKVPHMGWNVADIKLASPLCKDMEGEQRFYFVHSYHVVSTHAQHVVARTKHGYEFDSIIQAGNIYGAQFHPEKSHKFGMRLLKNFATI